VTQEIDIKALIRTVPDFPKPGILFRDITTLLKQADSFHAVVEKLGAAYRAAGQSTRSRRSNRAALLSAPRSLTD